MKLVALLIVMVGLTGCTRTIPIIPVLPEPPAYLKNACEPLNKIKEDSKLSEMSIVIVENYTKYHDCALKVETWNEFYSNIKEMYEKIKK